ncbi:MAG: GvpL/GvpF family gas vesicle protein [Cyanobacteria bacterium]|nr:GvpL/GvpF family gas vesicle protein [Cyanobacteriota bacterium]MDW8199822.1 GvpL/GvpF family gas vesicle protein [Cyanobacteriota bacterium SKYGB_h_bin112]
MGYGFYLYGIFPAPGPQALDLQGLDQQPVRVQLLDDFAILFSEAQQERYLASRRNLLDHEKVLETAMQLGYRSLLPLQFGLIVQDWQPVMEDLIIPKRDQLHQLLSRLQGKREVGVKLFWDNEAELAMLMAENQALKAERDRLEGKSLRMDEVIAIGQAIEQGLQARQQAIIDTFRATLNPLAASTIENDLLTDSMIYNAAYLIAWDDESVFSEQIDALDHQFENRLKIRYNNFTAPYNFAQLEQ